ncbi:hypothetical protein B0H17DRAFT_923858 [Mycena rosella]|uniref:HMG domain-containing protein n=1 Tax=Mycena rosella TaxID=1033263 RepID=A0AAD7E0A9_MYCRO|nr:hypothetical protein B0H17DRAFT_923858 [Mycena rosella]
MATPHRLEVLKARAIMTNVGDGTGHGTWKCNKDPGSGCPHMSVTSKFLRLATIVVPPKAISYLPILPPVWATLHEDPDLYPRPSPINPPAVFALGLEARCTCGVARRMADPTTRLQCTVYTLVQAFSASIEVQICHACSIGRQCYVGPDCRAEGFLNVNNHTLFSHSLLDNYTAAFTSSETPFVAWASVISRRYLTMTSEPFVGAPVFRMAWFLFAELQALSGDMTCPACGPHPEDTIWDGVTLAFSRKQLRGSLCPPTTVFDKAPEHRSHYVYQQTVLIEPDLRKAVRNILNGPSLISPAPKTSAMPTVEGMDEEEEAELAQVPDAKASVELIEQINQIPTVCTRLTSLSPALGILFTKHFGLQAIHDKVRPLPVYREFFIQIAAEESILQMIPVPALGNLLHFVRDMSEDNRAQLLSLPAVYNVLKYHLSNAPSTTPYPPELVGTLTWLTTRAVDVVARLIPSEDQLERPQQIQEDPWQESGCYYSMPAIRLHPRYPRLKHDQVNEGSKRGATCSKFYGQYGQQRLTGGIMCVWCTHSVCYGFHCIPQGEGRNDVFSAIVTHWPKAPKRIIYDFACALGPYCMTREPAFFAQTQFGIDNFHASRHTKCSPAAFLKSYAQVDPRLARINTSAAKCGNGGISRIQKGVSYMGQTRAIVYTQVFISIWNHVIIRKRKMTT